MKKAFVKVIYLYTTVVFISLLGGALAYTLVITGFEYVILYTVPVILVILMMPNIIAREQREDTYSKRTGELFLPYKQPNNKLKVKKLAMAICIAIGFLAGTEIAKTLLHIASNFG